MISPTLKVEIAFATAPLSASPVWTDVTSYTLGGSGYPVKPTRGRSYELDAINPGALTLTLNNDDGRFTPERVSSPYYPNVQPLKRIRVTATVGATATTVFDGHINRWPVAWLGTVASARVEISATDALLFFARKTLRSFYEEEVIADAPVYYWTLADASGAPGAVQSGPTPGPPLKVQIMGRTDPTDNPGSVNFGSGTGIGTDGLSAPLFTSGTDSRPSDYGFLGYGPIDVVTTAGLPSVSYEVTFATSLARTGSWMGVLGSWSLPSNEEYVAVSVSATDGTFRAYWVQAQAGGTTIVRNVASTASVWDGKTHHGVFVITDDFGASTTTGTLFVDGVQVATATYTGGTHGAMTGASYFEIGRSAAGGNIRGFDGTISHVAVYPSALTPTQVLNHYSAQSGWAGQTADQRLAKLASLMNFPSTNLETGVSVLNGQATSGQDYLSAMNLAAVQSEDGTLFMSRAGVLTFHSRWHRINRAVGFTITAGQVSPDVSVGYDHSLVKNVVAVSQQNQGDTGGEAVVRDTASIALFDVVSESVETVLPQANLAYRGQGLLEKVSQPRLRTDSGITVIVDSDTVLANKLLALDIGDSFAVTGLPGNGPSSTLEFDVDGIEHEFAYPSWRVKITTSPRPVHNWGVVDSTAYSNVSTTTYVGW